MTILTNKLNGSIVIHVVANTTLTIAGNNSVSNVATGSEVLTGATIRRVKFGSDVGRWTVKRGSNTVLVLSGTNQLDFYKDGFSINIDPTATLVLELSGTANGFITIELSKQGVFTAVGQGY